MLRGSDLKELLNYAAQNPVLSVYINTDPTQGSADRYRLRLRNLLKEVTLSEDIQLVERYLEHEYDWSGHETLAGITSRRSPRVECAAIDPHQTCC